MQNAAYYSNVEQAADIGGPFPPEYVELQSSRGNTVFLSLVGPPSGSTPVGAVQAPGIPAPAGASCAARDLVHTCFFPQPHSPPPLATPGRVRVHLDPARNVVSPADLGPRPTRKYVLSSAPAQLPSPYRDYLPWSSFSFQHHSVRNIGALHPIASGGRRTPPISQTLRHRHDVTATRYPMDFRGAVRRLGRAICSSHPALEATRGGQTRPPRLLAGCTSGPPRTSAVIAAPDDSSISQSAMRNACRTYCKKCPGYYAALA